MVGVDGDLVNRASFNHNLALKCIILVVEHHYAMMKAVRFAGFLCSFTVLLQRVSLTVAVKGAMEASGVLLVCNY